MKKILFLTRGKGIVDLFWSDEAAKLAAGYGFDVDIPAASGDILDYDFTAKLAECDGVITSWGSPMCNAELLKSAPNLKVIGHSAGSVASVVDESTYQFPVKVTSSNPIMAEAVAEWSLMMTMLAARDFWKYAQIGGTIPLRWGSPDRDLRDLTQMTLGIWGMGDTTRHLLRMLKVLRFKKILVASQHSSAESLAEFGAEKATFEEVFSQSDIIHCLVGVNAENLFKVGREEFAMIKDGATFINCGRARLVQEEPMIEALQTGRFTAILDVFHYEPLADDSPLRRMDNVILTPHNAGYTGRKLYIPFLLKQFNQLFETGNMEYEITRSRYLTQTNESLGWK
ncbi:MAG: hydroxyacid dehydrogenase [Victivallaceae bacterium]|nr:hydroxyacid dehydrogenase [Victivallaceae bacterium]